MLTTEIAERTGKRPRDVKRDAENMFKELGADARSFAHIYRDAYGRDPVMLVAFDKAMQQPAGAPAGNRNAAKTNVDIINVRSEPAEKAPTGTSAQAGIRRLWA